jgi:hypothetical protein
MSTSLINALGELSKQVSDYLSSTTTGAGSATTLVDASLMGRSNDFITDNTYVMLLEEPTSTAAIYDERKVTSLDNTTGTLTTLTFAQAPGTGIDYSLHRLFEPGEKSRALVYAAKKSYPYLHKQVRDVSKVSGNWLKDGSFEIWTSTTVPTYWTATTSTCTQTSTVGLFKHGSYSAALTVAAGTLEQSITNNDDLKKLAGKSVTFTCQIKSSVVSKVRISIYDGTTYTYSSYNDQILGWTDDGEPLEVTATIQDHPSAVTFTIHATAIATTYVDDARVICGDYRKVYIGDLGLANNIPHQVLIEPSNYYQGDDWILLHDIEYNGGYMYLPPYVSPDLRLKIVGMGYLDFLASGVASTAWTATIDIDSPQTEILYAQAILYLYTMMALPNFSTGDRTAFQEMMGFWKGELAERVQRFSIPMPAATMDFSA